MPDYGLTKAIRRAVSAGSKEAKVLRPGEVHPARGVTQGLESTVKPITPAEIPTPSEINPNMGVPPAPTPEINPNPVLEPAPVQPVQPASILETQQQAEALSRAKLEDYKLDESFQTNFDTITTTDDIKAVIADVAKTNATKIDEARRGTITNEQLKGLADDLDLDTDVVQQIMARESGGTINAETILAARQVLNSSAERLKMLADKIAGGTATDADRVLFRRQFQFHGEYQTQFMGARAEAGRALNAFSIPVGADARNFAQMRQLLDNQFGDIDTLAKVVSETTDPVAINTLTRKYPQSKVLGVANELFKNSILSGPKTHIVNTWGNALMQGMNITETAVAARIGRFLGSDERVEIGEATALLHGTINATGDALRLAGRAAKEGRTIDDIVKFERSGKQPVRAISAENLLPAQWQSTRLGQVTDVLGSVIRAPTERVMAPTDEFFKTLAYRAELERQAFLHVQQQVDSGAIQLDQAARVAKDFMEDAPLTAQKAATDYAQYVTFQNSLGESGQNLQRWVNSVPALGLIAPFIRTPINIFKAGLLDRSPVAFFSKKFYKDMEQGGRVRDMALARVAMGSATSAFIANEVIEGNVSGGGPRDVEARQLLEASGWRPYSIKAPDGTWHSYARMEPWASVVGATADTVEIMSYLQDTPDTLKDENQQAADAAAAIIAGIANNTMSKTFMKGMSDFSEVVNDPGRYAKNYGSEMATAMVPYSAFRKQMGQTQDPYLREAWTLTDKLKTASGIPGWSQDAPPRRDIFGAPRRHYEGSVLGAMSPIPESKAKSDPLVDELLTLMKQTRIVPITMPGKSIEGMRLTAKEYDDLVLISRTHELFGDRTFREEVERVMDTKVYQDATPVYRAELIRGVQQQADAIAAGRGPEGLEKQNDSFADRIALYRSKQDRLRFGEE